MADDRPASTEERIRFRFRLISGIVFLILVTVLALADTFGTERRVSEFIFASLLGAAVAVGVGAADRIVSAVDKFTNGRHE